MTYRMPITDALAGPFADWLGEDDWSAWYAAMKAMHAEPLSKKERLIFSRCTGLDEPPTIPAREFWAIVGRKGRKSAIAAALGVYAAAYGVWKRAAGERLRVLIISQSKGQARLVRDYALAILQSNRGLARLIETDTAFGISLSNGVDIECVANDFRRVRGPTVITTIFDEVAFWRDENSANPDVEVLRAVKPAMIPHSNSLLIGLSSPYARRGLLYERWRDHHRVPGRILVWQADTETMNPQIDPEEIAAAYREDEAWARAEFGAEFRNDIEQFLNVQAVTACIVTGIYERSPEPATEYFAFCDPSGGSSDSMTLAIAHRDADKNIAILDAVREVTPPFSPREVVAEFVAALRPYRVRKMSGDRYAGEWVREAFRERGIEYIASGKAKSDIYLELPAAINSGRVALLDLPRLVSQLTALERRTARGGRDSIDHPRGLHDDVANAAAGALVAALEDAPRRWMPNSFTGPIIIGENGVIGRGSVAAIRAAEHTALLQRS